MKQLLQQRPKATDYLLVSISQQGIQGKDFDHYVYLSMVLHLNTKLQEFFFLVDFFSKMHKCAEGLDLAGIKPRTLRPQANHHCPTLQKDWTQTFQTCFEWFWKRSVSCSDGVFELETISASIKFQLRKNLASVVVVVVVVVVFVVIVVVVAVFTLEDEALIDGPMQWLNG